MGTGEIALPSLRWLIEAQKSHDFEVVGVYTQPDKPVGRRQILTPPEVKEIALSSDIPVFQPESFRKDPGALDNFATLKPDLAVVMAYGQILPKALLETPRRACVNLHASLLPRHRGASPIQAAIRDGDEETGITLMHVAPKLDAGDMILKETIPIRPHETGGSLHDRLAELGPIILEQGLPLFSSEDVPREEQVEADATYSGKLDRADGHLDWSQNAESLERLIRAYDPWPGTYSMIPFPEGPKKLKIFPQTSVEEGAASTPGQITVEDITLLVGCGDKNLRLQGEVQIEGKKRLPIRDWLRGVSLPSDMILK